MRQISCDSQQPAFEAKRTYFGAARGRKGKGGGSSGGIEAPNTLQSHVLVGIIDLLGEGPIGGLVNGGQSIYFNNMPMLNSGNQYNFKGVTWTLREGTPDQAPVPGFPSVNNTVSVGTLVSHLAPITFPITNTDCTRAAVTIEIPALFVEDTKNGNINPFQVHVVITVTPEGGTATTVVNDTIAGKCTAPYNRTFTFPLTGEGPWVLTISRPNADQTVTTTQDAWYLGAVDEIVDHQLIYPNCAYVALTFDSEYFGSTLPSRTYDIQGLIINVPANYNPATRTYATTGTGTSGGTWDGFSFVPAVTDNPAWIIYDVISNNRYGMGLPAASLEATKWDLYLIGQYCDENVPDGYGGTEPRYTCNVSLTNRDDAYRVLQTLTSIFRGMTYWSSGAVRVTADMPGPVAKLVTQANVADGNFVYEGTSLKTRHTMAIVNYLEPSNYWQALPVVYQDPDLTTESVVGPQIIQMNAVGATSAGQAYRQGHWLIDSEHSQTDTVTYQCGWDHLGVMPGEIIEIADPAYAGLRMGGRIKNATAATVSGSAGYSLTLDGNITHVSGDTYAISVALVDGTLAQEITPQSWTNNDDGTTTVTIFAPAAAIEAGAVFIMTSSALAPRQFRVIGVTEPQPGTMEVTALLHDPNKYERVEYGIDLADPPYSVLAPFVTSPIGPPSAIQATSYFVGEGSTTVLRTTVGWTPPIDLRVVSYDISATSDQGYTGSWPAVAGPSYDIDHLPIANYTFGVRSRTQDSRTSEWAYSAETLINGDPAAPPTVTGLTAVGGARSVALSWADVGVYNLLYYEVWRAPVTGADSHGVGGEAGTFALVNRISATSWTDSDSTVLLPLTTWAYKLRAFNTLQVDGAFCAPAQTITTVFLTDDLADAIINTAKIAQGFEIVGAGTSVPVSLSANDGQSLFFNATDGKLYKWSGTAFTAAVATVDLTGEITSTQIVSLTAEQITGELTSDQIASLATAKLAGQIEASQLAAGSVTTEALAVGNSTNYIWNPCCGETVAGWTSFGVAGGGGAAPTVTLNPAGIAEPGFSLYGFGSAWLASAAVMNVNDAIAAQWVPGGTTPAGVPVTGGQTYGGAAEIILSSGLTGNVQICWLDSTGAVISYSAGSGIAIGAGSGNALSSYGRATVIGTAPTNAGTALLQIIAKNLSGSTTSAGGRLAFTQTMFGPLPPNATNVGAWQPGGVTTINGGVIQAESITALQLAAETITADKIAANSITAGQIAANTITADQIAANTITSDQIVANGITTGSIAAGAIGAAQIAAGAIEATNLAADFALFNYEQVGFLTVNNLNIVGGSISSFYSATSTGSTGTIITLTITTGNNADSSSVTRSGIALLVVGLEGPDVGDGNFEVNLYRDSGNIASRSGGVQSGNDTQCVITMPVTLTSGSTTFTVTFGHSGSNLSIMTGATLMIFCTSV